MEIVRVPAHVYVAAATSRDLRLISPPHVGRVGRARVCIADAATRWGFMLGHQKLLTAGENVEADTD